MATAETASVVATLTGEVAVEGGESSAVWLLLLPLLLLPLPPPLLLLLPRCPVVVRLAAWPGSVSALAAVSVFFSAGSVEGAVTVGTVDVAAAAASALAATDAVVAVAPVHGEVRILILWGSSTTGLIAMAPRLAPAPPSSAGRGLDGSEKAEGDKAATTTGFFRLLRQNLRHVRSGGVLRQVVLRAARSTTRRSIST